jgi:hypothetical protein
VLYYRAFVCCMCQRIGEWSIRSFVW